MKTLTVCALFAVLTTGAAECALAQKTGALQVKPVTATTPLIQCAAGQTDARASQPCNSQNEKTVRYASGLTRQEFECTLLGNCVQTGNADRTGGFPTL